MLLQKEHLNELRQRFRLNIYELKIWTSLLSKGIAAASELADISGVPRSRCYDVLESLEKKGFAIMAIGKPIKYIAVEPEAVLDIVRKNLMEDAELSISTLQKIETTDVFKELELLHKTGIKKIDVESITDFIIGRDNINRFLKAMMLRAKKKVTIHTNEDGIKHKLKILKKVKEKLAGKSVRLYTNVIANIFLENVEVLKTNHDVRFVNIDDEEIFFIMADGEDSGLWIKSPYFVNSLNSLFEKGLR